MKRAGFITSRDIHSNSVGSKIFKNRGVNRVINGPTESTFKI